jgi:predicted phosphodiesterase
MKFILISDVHIDHSKWQWDILDNLDHQLPIVVAGDISNNVFDTSYWLVQLRNRFNTVIWVAGNHCCYNNGLHQTRLFNQEFDKKWPYPTNVHEVYDHYTRWSNAHDIHFLNRSSIVVQGVEFIGTTGWHNFDSHESLSQKSQIEAWQEFMWDSHCVHWNDPYPYKAVLRQAQLDADYIRSTIKTNELPKVVVTHHIPQSRFVKFTNSLEWNLLNGSFLNTWLSDCVNDSVKCWCFGHTHFRVRETYNGVDFINNARGYGHESADWKPLVVEVAE